MRKKEVKTIKLITWLQGDVSCTYAALFQRLFAIFYQSGSQIKNIFEVQWTLWMYPTHWLYPAFTQGVYALAAVRYPYKEPSGLARLEPQGGIAGTGKSSHSPRALHRGDGVAQWIERASLSRSDNPRFEPRQKNKKNLWRIFRVKNVVLNRCRCAQPPVCIRSPKNDHARTLIVVVIVRSVQKH